MLLEDCAHCTRRLVERAQAGHFGDAGHLVVRPDQDDLDRRGRTARLGPPRADRVRQAFRNYGKPDYRDHGLNYRMNEFTAALGMLGAERMKEIVAWKNRIARNELDPLYPARLELPDGMVSGYYKYIVFQPIARSTGKVYDEPCHRVMGHTVDLPNTDWVAENHWCVPLYYRPAAMPDHSRRFGLRRAA